MMKQTLLKTIVLGLMAMVGVNAWGQTTLVVKDQASYAASGKSTTVTYADGSKTVAYTDQNDGIWYLGTYNLATITSIDIIGAAFVSNGETKAQLRIAYLPEGTVTNLNSAGISAQSGNIRADGAKLARITAVTTPTTIGDGKNATHYEGANFTITSSGVSQNGSYSGTCTIEEGSNTFGLQKTKGIYQLFLYGNAQSRRLAIDKVTIHFVGENKSTEETVSYWPTMDTYVRSDNSTARGSETTMEIKNYTDATDDTKNRYFYGLMSFGIDGNINKVKSATLRLVTEQKKDESTHYIYDFSNQSISSSTIYSNVSEAIGGITMPGDAVANFTIAGQNNKAVDKDNDITSTDVAAWTNSILLTDYVKSLSANNFNLLIAKGNNANNSSKFFTSDVSSDITNSQSITLTNFTANNVKPKLTVVYDYAPSKSYTLTVTDAGAATLMLPYPTTIPTGVTCYTLSYSSGDEVTATPVSTTLPANTPVLVIAKENDYTFNATSDVETLKTAASGVLTGVCAETIVPADNYILTKHGDAVGFRMADGSTNKVQAYRAYMTASYAAGAREFLGIDFDGDVTAINAVEKKTVTDDGEVYNLQGVRMTGGNLPKGIYVKNGKKFVIK